MKKSLVYKFGFLVLVLTLVTTSLVSGTYAKYTTEVTGTGTVTVAKWQADFEGNVTEGSANFNLVGTLNDDGVDGDLLAPGTVGSFALDYDTDDSQVARNVTITLDASDALTPLTYLKFYSDALRTTEIEPVAGVLTLLDEDFGPTDAGTGTVTVYWEWEFESDAAQDTADTIDGIAGATYDLTVTFTATQLDVAP